MENLEGIFDVAATYARGSVDRPVEDEGCPKELTIAEKQMWARIASYTAQIINSIAKGIDERQIDEDLDMLEEMLNKTKAAVSVTADGRGSPGKSEVT